MHTFCTSGYNPNNGEQYMCLCVHTKSPTFFEKIKKQCYIFLLIYLYIKQGTSGSVIVY